MSAADLAARHCVPCEGGTPVLEAKEVQRLLASLPEWRLDEGGKRISRQFRFKDFVQAVDFVNRITPVAEEEGHHPDLELGWGRAKVEFTTHAAGGLTENDFVMAAKVDRLGP